MDTDTHGYRRSPSGGTEWGPGETHDLNFNWSRLEITQLPYSDDYITRYVGSSIGTQSFPGDGDLLVPVRYFETIQDAIDDITSGETTPQPVFVAMGSYDEEIVIDDKSINLIGMTTGDFGSTSYSMPILKPNRLASSSGRAAFSIRLQNSAGPEANSGIHPARFGKRILISNFWIDNYGEHACQNQAHDSTTTYYLNLVGEYPTYINHMNYLSFSNCVFRGQTWGTPPDYSWFKYGFYVRASATRIRFNQCNFGCFSYGGGDRGKPSAANPSGSLAIFQSPFYFSSDGTNIWNIPRKDDGGASGVFGVPSGSHTLISDHLNQRVAVHMYRSSFYFEEDHGTFGWDAENPPYAGWPGTPEYTGTGWRYGGQGYNANNDLVWSDSSSAIFTLSNTAYFSIADCLVYPAHSDPQDGLYDVGEEEQWTNFVSHYNRGLPSDVDALASNSLRCYAVGFDIANEGVYLGNYKWYNGYANHFGYSLTNNAGVL